MATAQSAREFFSTLTDRVDPVKAAQVEGSYGFEITGAGRWTVDVRDGAVAVAEGLGEADVTITTSEELFLRLLRGEQSPTTAYMTGKLKMKGDIGAAMKLSKLF